MVITSPITNVLIETSANVVSHADKHPLYQRSSLTEIEILQTLRGVPVKALRAKSSKLLATFFSPLGPKLKGEKSDVSLQGIERGLLGSADGIWPGSIAGRPGQVHEYPRRLGKVFESRSLANASNQWGDVHAGCWGDRNYRRFGDLVWSEQGFRIYRNAVAVGYCGKSHFDRNIL